MNKPIFEALQSKETRLRSYINIIYTDDFNFTDCCINEEAATNLKSYLTKLCDANDESLLCCIKIQWENLYFVVIIL